MKYGDGLTIRNMSFDLACIVLIHKFAVKTRGVHPAAYKQRYAMNRPAVAFVYE